MKSQSQSVSQTVDKTVDKTVNKAVNPGDDIRSNSPPATVKPTENSPPATEKIDLIMLAAGVGTRAGLGYPKQFARLGGKPILIHTMEVFYGMPEIGRIIVTYPSACIWQQQTEQLLIDYGITGNVVMVRGGNTRQESVRLALEEITTERVIIHEAVRPFISREFVRNIISNKWSGVTPVLPISFSMGKIGDSVITGIIDRRITVNIQLPQVFYTDKLNKVHNRFIDRNYTEDSAMFYEAKYIVKTVSGLEQNIKITTPLDLLYAEVLHREGYCGSDRRE